MKVALSIHFNTLKLSVSSILSYFSGVFFFFFYSPLNSLCNKYRRLVKVYILIV